MTVDWEKIREMQFPALKKLTYIMAASASPLNKSAYNQGINYFNDMLYFGDIHFDNFCEEIDIAREIVADYINAQPEEIAFLTNTSSGMNVIAHILEKEKEIIYPSIEFPASVHIFKRLGFPCRKIPSDNNKYLVKDFRKIITNNTKYMIHSYVQSLTGFRQNLSDLGSFCQRHNLININNATQSFCAFEIDVKKHNIDMLVSNFLKWGGCGYGAGILYINNDIITKNEIPFSGWLSVEDPFSMDNDNLKIINKTRYMDALGGCPNYAALLSMKGSLDLIKYEIGNGDIKKGVNEIQNRIIWLTSKFLKEIQNFNFKIITPLEMEFRSGIITLEHKNAEEIYEKFVKNDIYITLKKYPNATKNTLLRFAFNYYNNIEDINRVITVLNSLKKYDLN